ncbi:MAG TPA: glycosyltransferase family 87 protein [Xanthobacteraceae bacterium]|nr:glycosyltransferase family 87 protein [Xanthobacteraceae bacterium]
MRVARTNDGAIAEAAAPRRTDGLITKAVFVVVVAYIALLASAYACGDWLVDNQGRTIQTDFINVWAAGRLVLTGHPADAYDWPIHKAAEEAGIGHSFNNYFGWHYPPPFLFIAALLARLPYLAAFLVWMAVTMPAYAATIRAIVGRPVALALACAFPGALWNVAAGQNGFMTAALLGGALVAMESQPLFAGILIGLLTYKPQFGLLFPLLLAVTGQWRIFLAASLTMLAMIGTTWWAFGLQAWRGFFDWLPVTSQLVLGGGFSGFDKLQTTFGMVRSLGGSEDLAWVLQIATAVFAAGVVLWIWRQHVAYEIKAAALATASLMCTPYLYLYDLVVLAVPIAFLIRLGFRDGFLPHEIIVFLFAAMLVLVDPFRLVVLPIGSIAVLAIFGVVCWRAFVAGKTSATVVAAAA